MFEPIVFSDLALLGQIVRHPKLYFLDNLPMAIASVAAVGVSLGVAMALEPAIPPALLPYGLGTIAWGILLCRKTAVRQKFSSWLLSEKLGWGSTRLGLLTALVLQFICWLDWRRFPQAEGTMAVLETPPATDMIVVQLESFVDLAPHIAGHTSIWRELQQRSQLHGKLLVPARGANTMRTEHAVLTGLDNAALQFDRFDPYLRRGEYARAFPAMLGQHGWTSTFIHPNDLSFFRRDRALPDLGFDRLVGGDAFANDQQFGPYVWDAAVMRKIVAATQATTGPHFIFAVTMENHGPWKQGRLPDVPAGLPSYLAHQRNTDAALAYLLDFVLTTPRRTILVLYGDHAPALDNLPSSIAPYLTAYVIIDSAADRPSVRQDLSAEEILPAAFKVNQGDVDTQV